MEVIALICRRTSSIFEEFCRVEEHIEKEKSTHLGESSLYRAIKKLIYNSKLQLIKYYTTK